MADLPRLFGELVRFETELWDAIDSRLRADHELPLNRFEPMQVIGRRGSCRVQDIAEDLRITVGGVSKLVDRIESSGLCQRLPNPDDRRSPIIELTSEGRYLLTLATASFEDELTVQIGVDLSAAEINGLAAILTQLRAGLTANRTDERTRTDD